MKRGLERGSARGGRIPSFATDRDRVLEVAAPLVLEHGGELRPWRLAYRSWGPAEAPAVLVLGGISSSRHVTSGPGEAVGGWWPEMVGPGRPVDTTRYCVVGIDYLGAGDSTRPGGSAGAHPFPALTPADQAAAVIALLDALGVARLHAAIGASYGGMVALALAAHHAERIRHALVISAAHESHPMATALRSLQRRVVRLGLATGAAAEGVRVARGIAMTTYRTAREFADRFAGPPARTGNGFRFPVDDYLDHHGAAFAGTFPPASFLCLSESLDLHRVDPAAVRAPVTLVAVDSDTLVPPWQMRALHAALRGPARLVEIASRYGHDAFLKEIEVIGITVRDVLCPGETD